MEDLSPYHSIAVVFSISQNKLEEEHFPKMLAEKINRLIINNFEELIRILYRLDIDEKKLKETLAQNSNEDAGILIASMIIDREKQKAEARKNFRNKTNNSNEERW